MTREEFERELSEYAPDNQRTFSAQEYVKIEFVYTYHPAISNLDGKRQIAVIWQEGGISVIQDMEKRARAAQLIEHKIARCRTELDKAIKEYERLKQSI